MPLFVMQEDGTRRATPFADAYYDYAKRVLAERARLDHAFDRIIESDRMDIRLACSLGTPGFLGPSFVEGYKEAHPNVTIHITEAHDTFCEALVTEGTHDLALVVLPAASELEARTLYTTTVLWWVHKSNPLANKQTLSVEDLVNTTVAIPGDEFKCNQNLVKRAEQQGVTPPSIVRYSEIFWIYEFALQKKGIGFSLPHLAALDVFQSEDLVAIPSADLTWGFGLVWPECHTLTNFEHDFVNYTETFSRTLPFQISS